MPYTIHTLYIIYSYIGITPGGFMLWRTAYSATQRRQAKVFRPATAAAHITYDRHISKRQILNAIFTRSNPNYGVFTDWPVRILGKRTDVDMSKY